MEVNSFCFILFHSELFHPHFKYFRIVPFATIQSHNNNKNNINNNNNNNNQ